MLVVWEYQQNQLIFGTGGFFLTRKREKKLVLFSPFGGVFALFFWCFCVFGGCFCAFGFFLFVFRAPARFFFLGVVNFLGGTTPKRGIPALIVRGVPLCPMVPSVSIGDDTTFH